MCFHVLDAFIVLCPFCRCSEGSLCLNRGEERFVIAIETNEEQFFSDQTQWEFRQEFQLGFGSDTNPNTSALGKILERSVKTTSGQDLGFTSH